jgi:hypothetical protein
MNESTVTGQSFMGKVLGTGPITVHANPENRVVEDYQETSRADHPACSDEPCYTFHTQTPTSPDSLQVKSKKVDHRGGQCTSQ